MPPKEEKQPAEPVVKSLETKKSKETTPELEIVTTLSGRLRLPSAKAARKTANKSNSSLDRAITSQVIADINNAIHAGEFKLTTPQVPDSLRTQLIAKGYAVTKSDGQFAIEWSTDSH